MIRLVTDSSCDLPAELVERHRITVVPLTIRFGTDEYVDRHDLTSDEFWMKLRTTAALPETAAPSAGSFLEAFTELAADGCTGVVVVCLSSEISATYQSAVIAAEQAPIPVKVVDSRMVSMALGFQVMAGAVAAEEGGDLQAVTDACVAAVTRTDIMAALDTLEFLKRGGRVGGAQAFIGGILDVKPIIGFANGVVSAAGRVRTRSKALAALTARVQQLAPDLDAIAVIHGDAPDAESFAATVRQLVGDIEVVVAGIGPVVGTHSGPGIIGIAYRTR
jgi:DegV family protein with EDD domain